MTIEVMRSADGNVMFATRIQEGNTRTSLTEKQVSRLEEMRLAGSVTIDSSNGSERVVFLER